MPKSARCLLCWSEELRDYQLNEDGKTVPTGRGNGWSEWVQTHTAFAFQGKMHHFNLLKESRQATTEQYWYAYQRQGKKVQKRYVGKDSEITPERLEEIGHEFEGLPPLRSVSLRQPALTKKLITRERLYKRLEAGPDQGLTLITAPAGSGKTTVVAQWIEQRREKRLPVAWIGLERQDNDAIRFWHSFLTSCKHLLRANVSTVLHHLTSLSTFPPQPYGLERVLQEFSTNLARSERQGMLILDDYQVITEALIHQSLAFFLEQLPSSLHLILITRSNPPLSLARLHVQGRINEIRADELRFTPEESLKLLQQALPELPFARYISQIERLLEGWAGGLRLLLQALQRDPSEKCLQGYLADFVNNYQPLQDYLVEEVLHAQSETYQDFLLHTSLADRLNASLCDRLMERENSAKILRDMEQAGLFLERLEGPGQWYRYQHFFAETLRLELQRRESEATIHRLCLKAAQWYEQVGMLAESIELMVQAQERARAAVLINRYLSEREFDEMHEFGTLKRWLEQIPPDILIQYPLLCLHKAQVLSLSVIPAEPPAHLLVQMEALLEAAEKGWQVEHKNGHLGEVYAMRAYLSMRQKRERQVEEYARTALEKLPVGDQHWRGMCLNLLGGEALVQRRLRQARSCLQEALTLWKALKHPHGARSCSLLLATVDLEQGALRLAANGYRKVINEARERGDREDLIPALLGLASISYEWNQLTKAEQEALEVQYLSEQSEYQEWSGHATLLLSKIWFLRGEHTRIKHELERLLVESRLNSALAIEIHLTQIGFHLREGSVSIVQHQLQRLDDFPDQRSRGIQERTILMQIRLDITSKRYTEALERLAILEAAMKEERREGSLLTIHLLQAICHLHEKRREQARNLLEEVLVLAQAEGYQRSLLDEGREIEELLRLVQPAHKDTAIRRYQHNLWQSLKTAQSIVLPRGTEIGGSLSNQERKVLRLLIADATYPEIARELTVSVNTIKTQVNSIYRKLNIHSRREARSIAGHLHLYSAERQQNHEER